MKNMIYFSVILLILVSSVFPCAKVRAQDEGIQVAREAGCLKCHEVKRRLVGPAFAWLAYEYKDEKEAAKEEIIDKITNGAKGEWGKFTGGAIMPPMKDQTTTEQRSVLADYILSLDPIPTPFSDK